MSRKTKASLGIAISSIAAAGGIMTPQAALAEGGDRRDGTAAGGVTERDGRR